MPKRIQRKRTKGWRMPEGAVYVGRPTVWGNPFIVEAPTICSECGYQSDDGMTAEQAVQSYRHHLTYPQNLIGYTMPTVEAIQHELRGKDLACWCPLGQPCHADVLLELANVGERPTDV